MLAIDFGSTVVIPFSWASFVALFIPVVTALVVRYRQSDKRVHIAVSLLLSAALAAWAALTDDVPDDTVLSVLSAFMGVIVPAVVSYLTAGKALHLNEKLAPTKGV